MYTFVPDQNISRGKSIQAVFVITGECNVNVLLSLKDLSKGSIQVYRRSIGNQQLEGIGD